VIMNIFIKDSQLEINNLSIQLKKRDEES
jgi:hypothetical protein